MRDVLKMLDSWGCDIPQALQRCCGDTEFYLHWISQFVRDPDFEKLDSAIRAKNYEAAFEAAHGLKGSSGTLGLTPLYESVCTVVEDLRYGPRETLDDSYKTMRQSYGHFREIMKSGQ